MNMPMRRWMAIVEATDDRLHAARQSYTVDAYHGTTADFAAFDPSRTGDIGLHFGTPEQADRAVQPLGRYLDGANIIPVRLRLRNPLRVKDMFSTLRTRYIARAKTWCLETPGFHPNEAERAAIFSAAKAADRARRLAGTEWGALNPSLARQQAALTTANRVFWDAIKDSLLRQGYDGLVYQNRVEGRGDSYVVFDPAQVRARHASFDPDKVASANLLDWRQR